MFLNYCKLFIKTIPSIFKIALGIYVLLCLFLYLFQERLLFFPPSPDISHYQKISQNHGLQNHKLTTTEGVTLDGWIQIDPNNKITLLYFGGNAEDVSYFVERYKFKNANIVAFNYRGYGYSTGNPSEKYLFIDALKLYDYLTQGLGISPDNLYLMGRSLGTGMATYLASQEKVAGVILLTPYDAVENIAKEKYSWFPVSLLLKNKFRSYEYAQNQHNSILCIYGGQDNVVPNIYTENLLKHWNGSIERIFIPEANHDNINTFEQTKESVERFINSQF